MKMKLQNSFFITCIILISAHCSYGAQKCYKEWADLASDLFDVAHDASFTGGNFTLCKDTIFNIEFHRIVLDEAVSEPSCLCDIF